MESLLPPLSNSLTSWEKSWDGEHELPSSIGVAFSGGMDSTVLLHWLFHHRPSSIPIVAYHVHHGLQTQSQEWITHCQRFCDTLGVPFYSHSLDPDSRKPAESMEAWARTARYSWLSQQSTPCITLGHHQTDQAETILLQLLRGSGIAGLASMSMFHQRHNVLWWRPFLGLPRTQLETYARAHHLKWIEDPSNQDKRYHRNWVRHTLLPVIEETYPQAEVCLARTAAHCAETWNFIELLSKEDLLHCSAQPDALSLPLLKTFSHFRQKQILRAFIHRWAGYFPSTATLEEVQTIFLKPIDPERHRPELRLGRTSFTLWKNKVWAHALPTSTQTDASIPFFTNTKEVLLPGGLLQIHDTSHVEALSDPAALTIILHQRGERLLLPNGTLATLKRLWQQASIPPWDRVQFPCIRDEHSQKIVWAPCIAAPLTSERAQTPFYTGKGTLLEQYPHLLIRWLPHRLTTH